MLCALRNASSFSRLLQKMPSGWALKRAKMGNPKAGNPRNIAGIYLPGSLCAYHIPIIILCIHGIFLYIYIYMYSYYILGAPCFEVAILAPIALGLRGSGHAKDPKTPVQYAWALEALPCQKFRVCTSKSCTYIYTHIYLHIYICYPPLLSTHLGLLNRVLGVEDLGLEMCMDESLGHKYLSLAASHGSGLADRRRQLQQSYSYPSSVKKANPNQSVKGNSPGHGDSQS